MGMLIEVDFVRGEILHGVAEYDRDFTRLLDDFHEATRQGGVAFDELDEEFRAFARAVGGGHG